MIDKTKVNGDDVPADLEKLIEDTLSITGVLFMWYDDSVKTAYVVSQHNDDVMGVRFFRVGNHWVWSGDF